MKDSFEALVEEMRKAIAVAREHGYHIELNSESRERTTEGDQQMIIRYGVRIEKPYDNSEE